MEPEEGKKVDESWKQQAKAEKAKLAQAEEAAAEKPEEDEAAEEAEPKPKPKPESPPETEAEAEAERPPLPEPSLALLVSGIATQAYIGLGQIPHPLTQKQARDLDEAKHSIDTLQILSDKTQGNLTPEEKAFLDKVLYDLRMAYVNACTG